MGWTNDQAQILVGLALQYLNTTVQYSAASALTIDATSTFASAADIDVTDAHVDITRTVSDPTTAMLRFIAAFNPDNEGIISSRRNTDTVSRFLVRGAGMLEWGAGAATPRDVTLERTASGLLTLTGGLDVTGDLSYNGVSGPRGYTDSGRSLVNGPTSTGAEIVSSTLAGTTYKAGRAYKVTYGTAVQSSVGGVEFKTKLHYNNAAGTIIWQNGNQVTGAALDDMSCEGTIYMRNTGAVDLVRTIALTIENIAGGGNVGFVGYATAPRYILVEDCGAAVDYSMGTVIV